MQKPQATIILPIAGAIGYIVFSELSLGGSNQFLLWSLATMAWILVIFTALVYGKLKGRLLAVSVPAVLMISVSTVTSLLFLDLVSPRRGFIIFFALVLFLFLEHVRHEISTPSDEERLYIAEYARMVNIGSLFLVATASFGTAAFLPVPPSWSLAAATAAAFLWSWHLYAACVDRCGRPWSRALITTLIVAETYAVVQRLPVSMFVAGALVTVPYYLAANLLPIGETDAVSAKKIRKHVLVGVICTLILLATARWIN